MRELPILMNGPSVRATLDLSKTMTRRPIKDQDLIEFGPDGEFIFVHHPSCPSHCEYACGGLSSPFGAPGDQLYVRENFCYCDELMDGSILDDPCSVGYRVDLEARTIQGIGGGLSGPLDTYAWNWEHSSIKWRPSIHMPRWASRIDLLVKRVWVERVQEINEEDCIKEGIRPCGWFPHAPVGCGCSSHKMKDLWNSIYSAPRPVKTKGVITHYVSYPWEEGTETRGLPWYEYYNPWVWACEFEMVTR